MLRRVYDWMLRLAAHKHGEWALAAVSFIESSVFPIPPDVLLLPMVLADREALTCAVDNLLDNAVKYSPECKTVWLEAEATGAWLTIHVRDRGLGIAEEDQKHIFEKFYRGSGEAARHVKGAGLGLSLVKHIVAAHGGSVTCQSRPGEGSTFTVVLPALAGSPPESGA